MHGNDKTVVIAGAGPVGLALAIDLGQRGVDCLLIEQRDGTISVPRMGLVNTRSMEFCRRWGLAEQVKDAGNPRDYPGDIIYVTSMTGHELHRIAIPSLAGRGELPHTPEGKVRCSQYFFDPLLRSFAETMSGIEMRYRTRLDSFVQDEEGVTIRLTDLATGELSEVRASFLVGCDGSDSTVRTQLGIGLSGQRYSEYHVTTFFRAPSLIEVHDKGGTIHSWVIGPQGVWAHINAVNGRDLWRFELLGLTPDTNPADIDFADAIRRAVGADFDFEIISALPWTARQLVADCFGKGRVFIAGDAAHQNTPTGGHGMNTGLGDAVDLSWKIAAVAAGWGGERLLASYEAERRPVSARNVHEAQENYERRSRFPRSEAIGEDSPEGEAQRTAFSEAMERLDESRMFDNEGIGLGYRYAPSPICIADDGTAPPDDARIYRPTTIPGARAPHAWVKPGVSTLDLFGNGFVLLRFGQSPADGAGLADAAARRGVPLTIVDIADGDIARLYERALVLVRPDGHVAWRGDAAPGDPLAVIDQVRGAG